MEPKLETKSNRRQSRRAFNMETAEMEAEDALLDDAFGDGGFFPAETNHSYEEDDAARAADDDADWSEYAETRSGDVSESSQ